MSTVMCARRIFLICFLHVGLVAAASLPPNWDPQNWNAYSYTYTFRTVPCALEAAAWRPTVCRALDETGEFAGTPYASPVNYSYRQVYGQFFKEVVSKIETYNGNDFSFLAVSALSGSITNNDKSYTMPMFLKTALYIWENGVTNAWALPTVTRRVTNSLFVDMCPNYPCKRRDAMKLVHRASKGNWTKGQDWSPYRVAMIGRGETSEADEFVYHSDVILTANAMGVIGFKSDDPNLQRDRPTSTALFGRVDDHRFLVYLNLMWFFQFFEITAANWWLCTSALGLEFTIVASTFSSMNSKVVGGQAVGFGVSNMKLLGAVDDVYFPDISTTTTIVNTWAADIRGMWAAAARFNIAAFVKGPLEKCPRLDFLSFAFPWIIGKGFFWIGTDVSAALTEYTNTYYPQVVAKTNSQYKYSYPFDGMWGISKQDLGSKWNSYGSWYKTTMSNSKQLFDGWLQDSVLTSSAFDALSTNDQVEVALMLDAAWATMIVGSTCLSKFGTNYTLKNTFDETFQKPATGTPKSLPVWFDGLTGSLSLFDLERMREWDITTYKRTNCVQTEKAICDPTVLAAGGPLSGVLACLASNPDLSGNAVSASSVKKLYYKTLTGTIGDDFFGCSAINVSFQQTFAATGMCLAGSYYDAGRRECIACSKGKARAATEGALDCVACLSGKYSDATGLPACKACGAGKFGATASLTECEDCLQGTFRKEEGQSQCTDCIEGRYSTQFGASECVLCPLAKYQPGVKATQCLDCNNTFTTQYEGTKSAYSAVGCHCGVGTFNVGGACVSCAEKFDKKAYKCDTFNALPIIQVNYMTEPGKTIMYYCEKSDEACPGGKSVGEDTCVDGASGVACAWCGANREWKLKTGLCEDCNDAGKIIGFVFVALVVVLLAIKLRPMSATYSDDTIIKNVGIAFVSVPCSHIIDFLQFQTILSRAGIRWPKSNNSMFSGVASVFTAESFGVSCLVGSGDNEKDATSILIFLNLMPACLIALCFLLALPSIVSEKARARRMPHYIGASNTTLTVLVTFFVTILNFSIQLVLSTYPHPKTGLSSLAAFPYILTESDQKSSMTVIAYCALAVWCLGSLIVIAFCVYMFPFVKNVTFHRCTLALTVKYRAPCSWFILVEMLTKFNACVSVALYESGAKQMQYLVGVYTAYLTLLASNVPYRFLRHTISDLTFTCAKLLVVFMTASFITGDIDDGTPVLMVTFVAYSVFAFLFMSSLYLFVKGMGAHPQLDYNMWNAAGSLMGKYFVPVQNPFSDLANDANAEVYPWKKPGAEVKNAQLVAAELRKDEFKKALTTKDEHHKKDAEIISGFVPQKHSATFAKLTDSQRDVVRLFETEGKSSNETKKFMEEQQGLIKQLFDP